jgi:replicative DNA helicase
MFDNRIPPHSELSEQQLVGMLLRYPESALSILDALADTDFYQNAHQIIFRAVMARHTASKPWDLAIIYEDLARTKQVEDVGGAGYLAKVYDEAGTPANAEYHAEVVLDHAIRRKVLFSAIEMVKDLQETQEPANDVLSRFVDAMYFSARPGNKRDQVRLSQAIATCLAEIDQRSMPGGKRPIPTGFQRLDNVIGGFRGGELTLLGARPSVGKSALALSFLLAAAQTGTSALMFSLEMSATEVAARALSITTEVPLNQITGSVPLETHSAARLVHGSPQHNLPIWIDDRADHTPTSIATVARRAVQKHNVGLIVIDYLQLIRHEGSRQDQQYTRVGNTSRSLKMLARALGVPVICLAQINRESEARNDGMPTLADFRESGSLEQDADIAMLLWPQKCDAANPSPEQEIRLIVAKQRNGPRAVVPLNYTRRFTRFEDGNIGI